VDELDNVIKHGKNGIPDDKKGDFYSKIDYEK